MDEQALIEELTEALRDFGEHRVLCPAFLDDNAPCHCGLRAVLEEADGWTRRLNWS